MAAIRAARRRQGHELTPLGEAIVRTMAEAEPRVGDGGAEQLAGIRAAIEAGGRWEAQEEWRIGTWFACTIARGEQGGRPWFTATVACDGQVLSCGCPSLDRAYGFMRFYQALIVEQFYTVGPPWADRVAAGA